MAAKLYIVYYSLYGHVETLAAEIYRGASSLEGVEVTYPPQAKSLEGVEIYRGASSLAGLRVPETLLGKVLDKMKATSKKEVPIITPEQLAEADCFIFGFPSRFGMMAAQFKAFLDSTDELWKSQKLAGKPASLFWSTGFHGSGQENTILYYHLQGNEKHDGLHFVVAENSAPNSFFWSEKGDKDELIM